jgi:tetratricopeptide (TPR) repeat protein
VPLLVNNFDFKGSELYLTGKLAQLTRYNALNVPHDFFDEAMSRLRIRFLKQVVSGVISPTPIAEQEVVQRKIEEAAGRPLDLPEAAEVEAHLKQGNLYYNKENYKQAIEEYSKAIRLNSQYSTLYYNRGSAHYELGEFEQALVDLSKTIELDAQSVRGYYRRGLTYASLKDFERAIEDFTNCLRINPDYIKAYWARANSNFARKDWEASINDLSELIVRNPNDYSAYNNRAEAYFTIGGFALALSDYQRANELFPNDSIILAGLAITYHALGQTDHAKQLWQSLVAEEADYQHADWVQRAHLWAEPLVEEARKLIARL